MSLETKRVNRSFVRKTKANKLQTVHLCRNVNHRYCTTKIRNALLIVLYAFRERFALANAVPASTESFWSERVTHLEQPIINRL